MAKRFQTRVQVAYCHYLIMDAESGLEVAPFPAANGLIKVIPGAACVLTGLHTGPIQLQVELCNREPELEIAGWDDVVEVTYTSSVGRVIVCEPMGYGPRGLPSLVNHPGAHRFRLHVRGRDAVGWDSGIGWPGDHAPAPNADGTWPREIDGIPIEQHFLQVWPIPNASPEVLHKATDLVGRHRRQRAAR